MLEIYEDEGPDALAEFRLPLLTWKEAQQLKAEHALLLESSGRCPYLKICYRAISLWCVAKLNYPKKTSDLIQLYAGLGQQRKLGDVTLQDPTALLETVVEEEDDLEEDLDAPEPV